MSDSTNRLNRIETLLNSTAEQQALNTQDIQNLIIGISNISLEVQNIGQAAAENFQRFENLRQDVIADRRELSQRFDDAMNQMT